MFLDARAVESAGAFELYITAVPTPGATCQDQAHEVFSAVSRLLSDTGAKILQERVFASNEAMPLLPKIRSDAYGDHDDGVPPSWLLAPTTASGEVAGVQIHAVKSAETVSLLLHQGNPVGRVLHWEDCRYVSVAGVLPSDLSSPEAAAQSLLDDAEAILKLAGTDFPSITRTWFWLGDILSWYGEFNGVRNRFFAERDMIRTEKNNKEDMPASTGIGVFPYGGAPCALDFVTLTGPCRLSKHLAAAGNQDSAFKYGSAFSRATEARTPAGNTVYISGTAAIDMSGATVFTGDIEAQIRDTIRNVRGVLSDTGCSDSDVVYTFAYCKTPEVERLWQNIMPEVPWPVITVMADVCRDNLLFEVEATAVRGAGKLG